MHPLKIIQLGSSLAIVLPPDTVSEFRLKEGDTVYLDQSLGNTHLLLAETGTLSADPAVVEQLQAGHEFMRDYHAAFRLLSK